jgi:Zn-dependent peptidase ImmA (M78 family)
MAGMAVKAEVPITGSVLTWAMAEAGYDTASLAERLHVEAVTVAAWQEERERPGRTQFNQLVQTLRRPSAVFFLPSPPASAGPPLAFRSAPGLHGQQPSPTSLRQFRRARRVQTAASWVLGSEGPEGAVSLPRISWRHRRATDAGVQVRRVTGVFLAEQTAWRDLASALREWRAVFDSLGLLVFSLQLGEQEPRGFSAWDDHAPMIGTNTAYGVSARIFTMAHELGHLVTRTASTCRGWSVPDSDPDLERWCERFGAAFLLPPGELVGYLAREWQITPDRPVTDFATTWKLSRKLKVSARALAIALMDSHLAPTSLYGEVAHHARKVDRPTAGGGGGGQPRFRLRLGQYGTRAPRVLTGALGSGRLALRDVADYLGLSAREIQDLVDWQREHPAAAR